MVRQRIRIRFAKQGDLRLTSHRDLMRTWERLFRRAGVTLCTTEGFHPKPKMMFPSALALGIEGLDEVLEIELPDEQELAQLTALLRSQAPAGLVIHGIEPLIAGGRKTQLRGMTFVAEVPSERQAAVGERVEWLLAQSCYEVTREGRKTPLDLRPLIEDLALDGALLRMRLRVDGDGSARLREVLEALGLADLEASGTVLRRTAVELST